VRLSYSRDDGNTWSESLLPHLVFAWTEVIRASAGAPASTRVLTAVGR
jgi:hypothetical protein